MGTAMDARAESLAEHIRLNGAAYLRKPGAGQPSVRLVTQELRRQSSLYTFRVSADGSDRLILIKLASSAAAGREADGANTGTGRPRVAPPAEPGEKYVLEFKALNGIHRHISRLEDDRFGAVEVFELLGDHRGIAMEALSLPTLRQLAIDRGTPGRQARPRVDLVSGFRNAGSWLRVYHGLHMDAPCSTVHSTRRHFLLFVDRLTTFLGTEIGHRRFLTDVRDRILDESEKVLPDALPLGLAHGDFAMRNILLGPGARVTILDTLARHRMPVYRDLAHFVADLSCSVLPAVARRTFHYPVRLKRYRRAFLAGYFEPAAVPHAAIRLFEAQVLLERWSSAVARLRQRSTPAAGVELGFLSFYYRTLIRMALRTERASAGGRS